MTGLGFGKIKDAEMRDLLLFLLEVKPSICSALAKIHRFEEEYTVKYLFAIEDKIKNFQVTLNKKAEVMNGITHEFKDKLDKASQVFDAQDLFGISLKITALEEATQAFGERLGSFTVRTETDHLKHKVDNLRTEFKSLKEELTNSTKDLNVASRIIGQMRLDDAFEFSTRTSNSLKDAGIRKVRQLLNWSEAQLLKLPNFGRKSLNEVKENLRLLNLSLKGGAR